MSPDEPLLMEALAQGARNLHVLSLSPTEEPEVRVFVLDLCLLHRKEGNVQERHTDDRSIDQCLLSLPVCNPSSPY